MTTYAFKILTYAEGYSFRALTFFKGTEKDLFSGYIKLSPAPQVINTLNKHYHERSDLLLYKIDLGYYKFITNNITPDKLYTRIYYEPLKAESIVWSNKVIFKDNMFVSPIDGSYHYLENIMKSL